MDNWPLVKEEIDAGAELIREFDKFAPVKAAFWLKASDADRRHLYIASEHFNGTGVTMGYGEVIRLTNEMPAAKLDPVRVKLVGTDRPLAKAVVDFQERFPGSLATRFGGLRLGDKFVDEIYIYPPLVPASAS